MANKESLGKTVGVVLGVCLVCAVIVSSAAVGFRPEQKINQQLDKQTNILAAAGLLQQSGGDVIGTYGKYIEAKVLDLQTGQFVSDIDANSYDQYKEARKDGIRPSPDTAKIIVRPNKVNVYFAKDDQGNYTSVILPVNGAGLWNMMKAFIAIEADGSTVKSLVYYEQQETPGLGAEVLNPAWKKLWVGKKLFDKNGEVAIQLVKGTAGNDLHKVDALSGATLTSNGVQRTLDYWLGDNGFGPFLAKVRKGGLNNG